MKRQLRRLRLVGVVTSGNVRLEYYRLFPIDEKKSMKAENVKGGESLPRGPETNTCEAYLCHMPTSMDPNTLQKHQPGAFISQDQRNQHTVSAREQGDHGNVMDVPDKTDRFEKSVENFARDTKKGTPVRNIKYIIYVNSPPRPKFVKDDE